jgi:hypothetical protein
MALYRELVVEQGLKGPDIKGIGNAHFKGR